MRKILICLIAFYPLMASAIIVGGGGPKQPPPKPKKQLSWPCNGLLSLRGHDAFGVYASEVHQSPKMLRVVVGNGIAEDWQHYDDLDFSRYTGKTGLKMIIGSEFDLPPMGPEFDLPAKLSSQQRTVLSEGQNIGFINEKPLQLQALLRGIVQKNDRPGVSTWIPHSHEWSVRYLGICYSAYIEGFIGVTLRSGEIIYEMYDGYNIVEFEDWEIAFKKLLTRLNGLGLDNRDVVRIVSYQLHPAHRDHKFDAMTPNDLSFASTAQKLFSENQINVPFEHGVVSQTWEDIELLFYRTLPASSLIERNKIFNNF